MRGETLSDATATDRHDAGRPDSGLRHPPVSTRGLGVWLGAYMVMTGAFIGLGLLVLQVLDGSAVSRADNRVTDWFVERRTDTWNTLSELGSAFSDTITIVVATVLVCLVTLVLVRRWHETVLLGSALVLETAVFVTSANVVDRDRPDVEQLDVSPPTASFPSGHEGAAVAFYVGLAIIVFWHTQRAVLRSLIVAVAIAVPLIVALSRIYRGMHYLTDVLAGAAVGLFAVLVALQVVRLGTAALARRRADGDGRIPGLVTRTSTAGLR